MLENTILRVRSIQEPVCPFCKAIEGELLCFDEDHKYLCTRPKNHNGYHVACAGAVYHLVALWAPKKGFQKLFHTEAQLRK